MIYGVGTDLIEIKRVERVLAAVGVAQHDAHGLARRERGQPRDADAIALLHVATGRCPVLTMSGATPKKRTPKPQPEIQPGQNPF